MLNDLEISIADGCSLGARLLDQPGMNWATLGALICTAANEAAAERGAEHASELVAHADALAMEDGR